jgi:hypothetical protein
MWTGGTMVNWIRKLFKPSPVQTIQRRRLGVELFEDRTLPNVSMALDAVSHVLTVHGGAGADQVGVRTVGSHLRVNVNGHIRTFAESSISQIDLHVGKGNDHVVNNTGIQVDVEGMQGSKVTVGGKGVVALDGVVTTNGMTGTLITAQLTGSNGATGEVSAISGGTSLAIVATGLMPSTTYTVNLGTASAGTFTTDANGNAIVTINNITGTLAAGTAVSVQDTNGNTVLSGTFASPSGQGDDDDDDHDEGDGDHEGHHNGTLTATLTGTATGVIGQVGAIPTQTAGVFNFNVVVSGLTPNSKYTLQVGTTSIGTFNTDAAGGADVTLNNVPATVASGGAVTVLDSTGSTVLSGTFASPSSQGDDDDDDHDEGDGDNGNSQGGTFSASLTPPTSSGAMSTATGQILAAVTHTNGVFDLHLVASGLTANTAYTLEIGTTTIGMFTTDSNGSAEANLEKISATIASGTAVTIVDASNNTVLSGTFASLSNPQGSPGCGGQGEQDSIRWHW